MDFIISTIRTLLRHLWMILVGTALFTLFVIYYTRHMVGGYEVKATLYTGVHRDTIWRVTSAQIGLWYKILWIT